MIIVQSLIYSMYRKISDDAFNSIRNIEIRTISKKTIFDNRATCRMRVPIDYIIISVSIQNIDLIEIGNFNHFSQ